MSFLDIKNELYHSFLGSRERGFKDGQVELAKKCAEAAVNEKCDVLYRYEELNFSALIRDNQYPPLVTALNLLLQYITNLLPPSLPANWWSIYTKNTSFRVRLSSVVGASDILKKAGYTEVSGDSLTFPEDQRNEPNRDLLSRLATEVLLARVECEGIIERKFPDPKAQLSYGYEPNPQGYDEPRPYSDAHSQYSQDYRQYDKPHPQDRNQPHPQNYQQYPDPLQPQYDRQMGGARGGASGGHYAASGYDQHYPSDQKFNDQQRSDHNNQRSEYNQQRSDYDLKKSDYDQQRSGYDQQRSGSDQWRSGSDQRRSGSDQGYSSESMGFQYGHDSSSSHYPPTASNIPGTYTRPVVPSDIPTRANPRAAQTSYFPLKPSNDYSNPPLKRTYSPPTLPPGHTDNDSRQAPRESDPFLHKERSQRGLPDTQQGPDKSSSPQDQYPGPHSGSQSQSRDSSGPQSQSRDSSGPQSVSRSNTSSGSLPVGGEENPSTLSSNDSVPTNGSIPASVIRKRRMQELLEKARNARAENKEVDPPPTPPTPSSDPGTPHPLQDNRPLVSTAPVQGMGTAPYTPSHYSSLDDNNKGRPPPMHSSSSGFDRIPEEDENRFCSKCGNKLVSGSCSYCTPVAASTDKNFFDHPGPPHVHKNDSGSRPLEPTDPTWATKVPWPPEHSRPPEQLKQFSGQPEPLSSEYSKPPEPPRSEYSRPPEPPSYEYSRPSEPPRPRPSDPPRPEFSRPPNAFDEPPRDARRKDQFEDSRGREEERGGRGGATGEGPAPMRSEAADRQYRKYKAEIDWFCKLSHEEQKRILEGKIRHNETITHLKPYCKGPDFYRLTEVQEIEEFETLSETEKMRTIEDKRRRGHNVDHLERRLREGLSPFTEGSDFEAEEKKREKTKGDGLFFMACLKECTPFGFSPEEVQIALTNCKDSNPLHYLQTKWIPIIQRAIQLVRFEKSAEGSSYGIPTENEIRLLLIESKGDIVKAKNRCVKNRKEKVEQLFKKINKRFKVSWDDALRALSETDFNVDDAYYAIQRYGLKELYEYLMSDFSKIVPEGKTEMEYLKDIIIEKMKEKEPEDVYNSFLRMVTVECRLLKLEKAEILVKLLEKEEEDGTEYPLKYYIDAAKDYATFEDALRFLNQPCPICTDEYPMNEMVVLPACGDSVCKDCFKQHFELAIREKSVKHFVCPICDKPDLGNADQMQELNLELLVSMVKIHLEQNDYEMCQKKLTDFNLSKETGFVWCPHEDCGAGFINDFRDRKKLECPECKRLMCFSCKKKWEDQHEGLTCDQFAQWKTDNDPEAQKAGLAAILKENGIQCPACKFRYDLARGGCMHFHCTQCPHEFCSGCNNEYHKKADACGREYCKTGTAKPLGLHAHHPRDCLFYLRDFPIDELKQLLEKENVEYDTDPPEAQIAAAKEMKEKGTPLVPANQPGPGEEEKPKPPVHVIDGEEIVLVCQVMLQKETPDGLKDEECLKAAPVGMAGLCEVHYKEYLVNKINKAKLDPVELYNPHQVKLILKREEVEQIPDQDDDEGDDDYKARLIEVIKEKIPIERKDQKEAAGP